MSGILGLQSGKLDHADLQEVATALLNRENHPNFSAVGVLSEAPESQREEDCTALAIFLLSMMDPEEEPEGEFRQASFRFVTSCSPRSMWRWEKHLELSSSDGRVDAVRVSPYLAACLMAAEDLCSLSGWLVRRDESPT